VIHKAIEITTNVTSVLCAEKGWKEEDDAGLLVFEQLDSQKQLSITTNFRSDR